MNRQNKIFPVGTSFAPLAKATEVPMEMWEDDVKTMKGLGLNIYRLFIAWDRIERKRGEYDFTKVDHSFRLAEKYGIRIIVNLGGSGNSFPGVYAPRWLYRELGVTLRRKNYAEGNELYSNNFKLCYDDPVLRREMEKFVRLTVDRYKDSPALEAWSACNEVGDWPECRCPHTLWLFRNFLKEKYQTVEALSEAWGTENPMDFADWSEAFPATEAGFNEGGYQAFLDYKDFQCRNRDWIFNQVSAWLKSQDPAHPVIVHFCGPQFSELDCHGDIAAASTYLCFDRGHERYDMPTAELNRQWNYMTSLFQLNNAPWRSDKNGFWQLESEAGPLYWVHNLMPRSFSGLKMNARDMIFVSHGARCIMRWMYRSRQTDSQAGEFNLVGWDGSVLERSEEFGQLARTLNEHKEEFLTHEPESYEVAMLHRDWDVYWRWRMEDVDRYWATYRQLYGALCDAGVRPKVMNGRQLENGDLAGIKLLIIPFRPWITAKMAEVLREFVKNGGRLVVESPFAIKDMSGVHQLVTPGFGLSELFGCRIVDMDKVFDDKCGNLPCLDFKAIVTPAGCEVEERFADGKPAVITHRFQKGATRLYASLVFERCTDEHAPLYRDELKKLLRWSDILPQYEIEGLADEDRLGVSIQTRRLPDGRQMVFIVNLCEKELHFRLAVAGTGDWKELCAFKSSLKNGSCRIGAFGWHVATR